MNRVDDGVQPDHTPTPNMRSGRGSEGQRRGSVLPDKRGRGRLRENRAMDTTDAEALRTRQAPLKQQYKAHPDSALVTSGATGNYRDPGITATIDGWAGPIRAGQHRATGGDGNDACSAD